MQPNFVKAITLKLISTFLFAIMSTLIRYVGTGLPTGEVVFCRGIVAMIPVVLIYAWRGELRSAVSTSRPWGHLGRGVIAGGSMLLNFGAMARLPVVDATAIGFASPLVTVALAAVLLKERVRIYRWSAVVVGFLGILVMLVPHLTAERAETAEAAVVQLGVVFALAGVIFASGSNIQTRRLTQTETTPSIVFYFSLYSALFSFPTILFGWQMPTLSQTLAMIGIGMLGGVSHLFLTESYRYAGASVVAPFDYTQLFWVFIFGFFAFGEVPTVYVWIGSAIVAATGLFVIWRERQLGLRRAREVEEPAK